MKIFCLLYFLINLVITKHEKKEDSDLRNIDKDRYDEFYYSRKIRKTMNKLGLGHEKLIDKEDFKKVFMVTAEQSLNDFNFYLYKKTEKENYMKNLLEQIYYKLYENEPDDIDLSVALKKFEPNKILNAAEEIMDKLGYQDLVEKITNEVIDEDNKKKNKEDINNDL